MPATAEPLTLRRAEPARWVAMSRPQTTVAAGGVAVPSQRFKKDLIRTGRYVKVNANPPFEFEVTQATLDNWAQQFAAMQANGVKVGIPNGHAEAGDAAENAGWVESMWDEGGTLWMACNIIGADWIEAAAKSDVSIFTQPEFIDGAGNVYQWPITHVALCTDPVVPGLGEFIPIEMSRRLSGGNKGETVLDFLKTVGAAMGLDTANWTDENAAKTAIMEKCKATNVPAAASEPAAAQPPADDKKTACAAPAVAASAGAKAEPAPMVVRMLAENRTMKIEKLVSAGKISPPVAASLKDRFVGKENAAVSLALSSGNEGDFDSVIEALNLNESILKPGAKSAVQSIALQDGRKGDAASGAGDKPSIVKAAEDRAAEVKAKRAG